MSCDQSCGWTGSRGSTRPITKMVSIDQSCTSVFASTQYTTVQYRAHTQRNILGQAKSCAGSRAEGERGPRGAATHAQSSPSAEHGGSGVTHVHLSLEHRIPVRADVSVDRVRGPPPHLLDCRHRGNARRRRGRAYTQGMRRVPVGRHRERSFVENQPRVIGFPSVMSSTCQPCPRSTFPSA